METRLNAALCIARLSLGVNISGLATTPERPIPRAALPETSQFSRPINHVSPRRARSVAANAVRTTTTTFIVNVFIRGRTDRSTATPSVHLSRPNKTVQGQQGGCKQRPELGELPCTCVAVA